MLKLDFRFNIEDYFGPPMCRIIVDENTPLYDGPVLPEISVKTNIIVGEHELRIVHHGKTNDDHMIVDGNIIKDKHFELTGLDLDDVALIAELWEGTFFPVYNQDYVDNCKTKGIKLQYGICPNLYFGHNGTWRLNFMYPVYTWLISRRDNCPNLANSIFTTSDAVLKQAKDFFSSVPDIKWNS